MILTQKLKLTSFYLSFIIVILTISSCQSVNYINIISSPPCWQSICPDVSTKDEATAQLDTLEFVEAVWYDKYYDETRWNFSEGTGFIKYDQDQVVETIVVLFSSSEPTFDQLNEWLGAPSGAIAFIGCDDYGDIATALDVTLFYPEMYMTLSWRPRPYLGHPGEAQEITISGDQNISLVSYHSSASYNDTIQKLTNQVNTNDILPVGIQDGSTKLYVQKACN